MLESDKLICHLIMLIKYTALLIQRGQSCFFSHLVVDKHNSMVSRIVMSMARILIYMSAHQFFQICYAPGSG
ncbi:hypothetical protein T07_1382 [Trichinella nelsoni]|uniref:Uncharacterized protein n=1 Tax=Trichinella nelsoni TaxID=6336 RepID=A0A0V0SH33_9BILA|nr:hypothetical protein T07_1382 [Trichinella nelsoni]